MMVWNRELTDEEIASLSEDPYKLFTFRISRWRRFVLWLQGRPTIGTIGRL